MRKFLVVMLGFGAFALAGCPSNNQVILPGPGTGPGFVYWTFANSTPAPQAEGAQAPLTISSTVSVMVPSNGTNSLNEASPILFDSLGRIWIGNAHGTTCTVSVFSPPLTAASTPLFVLTLSGCNGLFGMAFDASGNLWASGFNSGTVQKFTGPFSSTATLSAANTLSVALPGYPAVDAAGNLYVAKDSVTYAVNVYTAPIGLGASPSFTLSGVTEPFAEVFDSAGNLYVGQRGSLVRYNSSNLSSGATPNIVDATGQVAGDFAGQLALDTAGNIYYSDCGLTRGNIYVFPTGTQAFSTTLAPSVTFSDPEIVTAGCVWGIGVQTRF